MIPVLNPASPAARGLIHAWPMFARGGWVCRDLSGQGESGFIHGVRSSAIPRPGPLRDGIFLGGGNERVTFGSQGFGAEFDINVDGNKQSTIIAIAQLKNTGARAMLFGDYSSGGGSVSFFVEAEAAGTWRATCGVPGATYSGGTVDKNPHCFVVTRYGYTKREAFFVDGVEIGSTTTSGLGQPGTQMALGAGLYTGSINWDGWVYDLRMYDRAMDDAEVDWHSRRENWFHAYERPQKRVWYVPPVVGGSFQAAWARNTNTMIQGAP